MRVGVYVGSFNPVHKGHKAIVNQVIDQKYVDKVIIVPTLGYWDKENLANISDRVNMLKFYENSNIIIDSELHKYLYTYQILDYLRSVSDDEFYLIIGSDNLEKFHLWKNVSEILKNYVLVIKRPGYSCEKFINNFKEKDKFKVIDSLVNNNISSTLIREFILENKYDKMKDMLDSKVLSYIISNNLYGSDVMDKCEMMVRRLDERRKTIATMESCTGGGVANKITNISGASDVLKFSAVTYSSQYKINMGVSGETIDKYTVYSPNDAREMSKCNSDEALSDIGVGITGKMDVIDDTDERIKNNIIYVSVYDRETDSYLEREIVGSYKDRASNKEKVIDNIIDMVNSLLR